MKKKYPKKVYRIPLRKDDLIVLIMSFPTQNFVLSKDEIKTFTASYNRRLLWNITNLRKVNVETLYNLLLKLLKWDQEIPKL